MKKDQEYGEIYMDDTMSSILQEQRRAFIEKFGREPGPSDPVFFDPRFDKPTPLTEDSLEDLYQEAILKTTSVFSDKEN